MHRRVLVAIALCGGWSCSSGGPHAGGPDGASPADAHHSPDAYLPDAGCVPSSELCNGIDDNCNGLIDEGLGLGMPCDGADADGCAEGVLTCAGCTDMTDDSPELFCNGVDDDCDGQVDEVTTCTDCCDGPDADACADDIGVCGPFGMSCVDAGGTKVEICGNGIDDDCDGQVDEIVPEACNGVDDDCDGQVDEGCSCGPVELICNGIDDDCDGLIVEISSCDDCCDSGDSDACLDDHAVCTPFGISCSDDGVDHVEQCGNVQDDDCDGQVDEGCV